MLGAFLLSLLLAVAAAPAATLEPLSLEELVRQSTAIVQGRVNAAETVRNGPIVYTVHSFTVERSWKGDPSAAARVFLPGGLAGGLEQRFSGVPRVIPGERYVAFLWTGPSGRTQITGLSQGLFEMATSPEGKVTLRRQRNAEAVFLDSASGAAVEDRAIALSLEEMDALIRRILSKEAGRE